MREVLKGFARLSLGPGERKTVVFRLNAAQLRSYDPARGWLVRPGAVDVMLGPSSARILLNGRFEISGGPAPAGEPEALFSALQVE
jgi:beta-glucosidase